MTKTEEFKQKLDALLVEYDACIVAQSSDNIQPDNKVRLIVYVGEDQYPIINGDCNFVYLEDRYNGKNEGEV